MVVCAVPGCGSNSKERSKYSFHPLPRSLIRRTQWVVALGPAVPCASTTLICSRHFEPNMLIKRGNLMRLTPGAVPTLFLDSSPTEDDSQLAECADEDEGPNEELIACRACLAAEGRLYAIGGSGLEDVLETLTGVAMPEVEGVPHHLCVFCMAMLSKCVAFRDSCQRSAALLQTLLEKGPRLGTYECDVCHKRFRNSHRLLRHRYTHRDRYTCRECGLVSRDSFNAKTHYEIHQGSSHPCPYCDQVYVRKHSCYNHVRGSHPEKNEPCDECGETFRSALGVRQHKALAHRPTSKEILKCKDCLVTFSSAEALQRHDRLGSGVSHAALWPCAACGECCLTEDALTAHAAEKHPPEQLHCGKCDRKFANEASFARHEARKHRGEQPTVAPRRRRLAPPAPRRRRPRRPTGAARRPFVCEICGRTFLSNQALGHHINSHYGIKPYSCPLCDKKFTAKMSLQQHMVTHTGEQPFQCEHCLQKFKQKVNLHRHVNNVHYKIRATCPICGKTMGGASIADHLRNIHGNGEPPRRKRDRKTEKKRKRPAPAKSEGSGDAPPSLAEAETPREA